MISRTLASVFPRQSPNSLILSSINFEADSGGTGFFIYGSNSRTCLLSTAGGQVLAGVVGMRRHKKYDSPQSTRVTAAQPQTSGPSPSEKWAMRAEERVMKKPA